MQKEVIDFIAFLKTRLEIQKSRTSSTSTVNQPESFVGMWADRQEMRDSTLWIRELRANEWKSANG
jgi:hypothetical protein